MGLIGLLKKIPLDLGQGRLRKTTEGKRIAMRLIPDGSGKSALDVGCGAGDQTRWLRSRGYDVTAIDLDLRFEGCQIVDVNEPLPFDDEQFDLLWCSEVIEHLRDPAASLAEMRRVTKRGGRLVLTTPNSYALLFRVLALIGLTPVRIQRTDHLHFFDYRQIVALCPDALIYGYFPYAMLKKTIRHFVGALSPTFVIVLDN